MLLAYDAFRVKTCVRSRSWLLCEPQPIQLNALEHVMSKGMNTKKDEKKKPAKTMKEKKAAKAEKKKNK